MNDKMEIDVGILHQILPKWIRIGPQKNKYYYQLVCSSPILCKGDPAAMDQFKPVVGDVLWLSLKHT